MSNVITVSGEDIIQYLKISCQIPSVLEGIATRKVIAEAAKQVAITLEPEELQEAADKLRSANKLHKAEETWSWLNAHLLSIEEFEEIIKTNLLSEKLAHRLFADKVEHFFYENKLNYAAAVTYEAVLDDEDLAMELFYALQENEISFQEIAREYIQDPEIRRAGGYQGLFSRNHLRPEIASAVFAANPPQALKPIVTPKGIHLIWVEEIIQPELDEQLRAKILGDMFTAWLQQQVAQLEIVVSSDTSLIAS
jgi:parvulin-like peptidyl-prolyl isomerase